MPDIRVEDIQQMYQGSIVLMKNKPVYIEDVGGNGDVVYLDILSQRREIVPFSLKTFQSPSRRIGFVNIMGSVIYAYRLPVRRYKVGISRDNVRISAIDGLHYPQGKALPKETVGTLRCVEVGDALMNKYPTLNQALKSFNEFVTAVAFDKQFAVDRHRRIFYKTKLVGEIPEGKNKTSDIVFYPGFTHLSLLLDGNYEKTIRVAGN